MQAWENLSAYLTIMAVHAQAQTVPVLAGKARLGFRTLAMALENLSGTRRGGRSELHAPAATQWLRNAGDEVKRLCEEGTERFMIGDLWESHGRTEVCHSARRALWKLRLTNMDYGTCS